MHYLSCFGTRRCGRVHFLVADAATNGSLLKGWLLCVTTCLHASVWLAAVSMSGWIGHAHVAGGVK